MPSIDTMKPNLTKKLEAKKIALPKANEFVKREKKPINPIHESNSDLKHVDDPYGYDKPVSSLVLRTKEFLKNP